jgi:hypothetical protein
MGRRDHINITRCRQNDEFRHFGANSRISNLRHVEVQMIEIVLSSVERALEYKLESRVKPD